MAVPDTEKHENGIKRCNASNAFPGGIAKYPHPHQMYGYTVHEYLFLIVHIKLPLYSPSFTGIHRRCYSVDGVYSIADPNLANQ